MTIIDAHIHLTDNEYSGYLNHIFNNLRELRITACSVTVNTETLTKSLELFSDSTRDIVIPFAGIHPEFAQTEDVTRFIEIFDNNTDSISGIGEIGLDPAYAGIKENSYNKQKEVFHSMLALAEKTKKPVSIHSRGSLDHILEMLKSYNIRNGLLHWFAGSKKQLARSTDMGLFVSYGPVLIYSEEKRVLLKNTPKDRFLVETDGPVRYRRFNNLPSMSSSFLVSVVYCAANVLGMTYQETVDLLERNAESYLNRKL
ncbi:MAG TPA: TatD family hydrolase [Candidatus Nitrosopolaris sp.]|nr:TatD family hydrolase [Candidatus Nitrosopolaris sp.]